jgi:hypothetical protein
MPPSKIYRDCKYQINFGIIPQKINKGAGKK